MGVQREEISTAKRKISIVWKDKKRWCGKDKIGPIPTSFTEYRIIVSNNARLEVKKGMLAKRVDNVDLYKVLDLSMNITLVDRIFGTGSICVESVDRNVPNLIIQHVKDPEEVMNIIADLVEQEKARNKTHGREMFGVLDDDD